MGEFFEGLWRGTPPVYKNFLAGNWVEGEGKKIEFFSAIDQQKIGSVKSATRDQADKAFSAARKAQREWQKTPLEKRARILHLVADYIKEYEVYLSILLTKEIAKPAKEARDEVIRTADLIDYFAEAAREIRGETLDSDSFPGFDKGRLAYIERVPLGVVLAISPFNYPLNLSASKIAPALVMGNAVVFKPSIQGAIVGLHLTEIFNKAGIPKGVFSCLVGHGEEIGDYLVTHPQTAAISFTGSSRVGKSIATKAGMIPLLFECGGNNPAIVLQDTDLEIACQQIVKGAFAFAGQRCTAIKYVLATSSMMEKLIPRLLRITKETIRMGDPRVEGNNLGPLVSEDAAQTVENRIIKAKVGGAKILLGGKPLLRRAAGKAFGDARQGFGGQGNYIEPTILDHVKPSMEIVRIETFGPVLSLIHIKNVQEAVEIVNNSDYGLQASIFTKDEGSGIVLAKQLEVGTVQVNGNPQRGPDHFPFLGVKGSGVGVQGVRYVLEAMTRFKPTVLNKPE